MIGVILSGISTFFDEIANTKGKAAVSGRQQSVYTMGFLQGLGGILFYIGIIALFPKSFIFFYLLLTILHRMIEFILYI